MKLAECPFYGFQGEGKTQGVNSLFIRFSGCNLRCPECDSKYTWSNGIDISLNDLVVKIRDSHNIIFTGGEPLLYQEELNEITEYFSNKNFEIETNGTIQYKNDNIFSRTNILFNISPKGNFYFDPKTKPQLLEQKLTNYIVKILFDKEEDFDYALALQSDYNIPSYRIYMQPKAINEETIKMLIERFYNRIIKNGFNLSLRQHIILFGNEKGF